MEHSTAEAMNSSSASSCSGVVPWMPPLRITAAVMPGQADLLRRFIDAAGPHVGGDVDEGEFPVGHEVDDHPVCEHEPLGLRDLVLHRGEGHGPGIDRFGRHGGAGGKSQGDAGGGDGPAEEPVHFATSFLVIVPTIRCSGTRYFFATRCTSAGVTAEIFLRCSMR